MSHLILICDSCGAHARHMQACSACKVVFYCNDTCQRKSWRDHHKRQCSVIAESCTAIANPLLAWMPVPFLRAKRALAGTLPPALTYTKYLLVIETFALPCTTNDLYNELYDCPQSVVDFFSIMLADELNKDRRKAVHGVKKAIDSVRSLFSAITGQALNTHSCYAWQYICANHAKYRWARERADNSFHALMHTHSFAKKMKEGAVRRVQVHAVDEAKRFFTAVEARLDTCACCVSHVSLVPVHERSTCMTHNDVVICGNHIVAVDFISRQDLDVFSRAEYMRFSPNKQSACSCVASMNAANEFVTHAAAALGMGGVRLRLSSGVLVDIVAFVRFTRNADHWCTAVFGVKGSYFDAEIEI